MIVHTESGSIYELTDNTVQRLAGDTANACRKDGEVVPLLRMPSPPVVGEPMLMVIDVRGDGIETRRQTTRVTLIEN